jgi:bifunctional DNA-binding transcriptional regulator/antitoxin component of YhaV-PrlF toxin-antitoxin module
LGTNLGTNATETRAIETYVPASEPCLNTLICRHNGLLSRRRSRVRVPSLPLWAPLNPDSLYVKVKPVARISSKHQVTLPVESLEAAGLRAGDEVVIEAEGADRIVVHRAAPDLASALGVFDGLYEPGYLEKLRSEERV